MGTQVPTPLQFAAEDTGVVEEDLGEGTAFLPDYLPPSTAETAPPPLALQGQEVAAVALGRVGHGWPIESCQAAGGQRQH